MSFYVGESGTFSFMFMLYLFALLIFLFFYYYMTAENSLTSIAHDTILVHQLG